MKINHTNVINIKNIQIIVVLYSRVAMEQFTFFLATALKFSPKMAHSDYNKERIGCKPFDDRFQNASKKKG